MLNINPNAPQLSSWLPQEILGDSSAYSPSAYSHSGLTLEAFLPKKLEDPAYSRQETHIFKDVSRWDQSSSTEQNCLAEQFRGALFKTEQMCSEYLLNEAHFFNRPLVNEEEQELLDKESLAALNAPFFEEERSASSKEPIDKYQTLLEDEVYARLFSDAPDVPPAPPSTPHFSLWEEEEILPLEEEHSEEEHSILNLMPQAPQKRETIDSVRQKVEREARGGAPSQQILKGAISQLLTMGCSSFNIEADLEEGAETKNWQLQPYIDPETHETSYGIDVTYKIRFAIDSQKSAYEEISFRRVILTSATNPEDALMLALAFTKIACELSQETADSQDAFTHAASFAKALTFKCEQDEAGRLSHFKAVNVVARDGTKYSKPYSEERSTFEPVLNESRGIDPDENRSFPVLTPPLRDFNQRYELKNECSIAPKKLKAPVNESGEFEVSEELKNEVAEVQKRLAQLQKKLAELSLPEIEEPF